eukprot:jgi/Botrbrau1/13064/Bobra.0187s0026.1
MTSWYRVTLSRYEQAGLYIPEFRVLWLSVWAHNSDMYPACRNDVFTKLCFS